eukprot:6213234-Pleurochrysis_carterae.AAC.2
MHNQTNQVQGRSLSIRALFSYAKILYGARAPARPRSCEWVRARVRVKLRDCIRVRVRVRVCATVRARARARARACGCACACPQRPELRRGERTASSVKRRRRMATAVLTSGEPIGSSLCETWIASGPDTRTTRTEKGVRQRRVSIVQSAAESAAVRAH